MVIVKEEQPKAKGYWLIIEEYILPWWWLLLLLFLLLLILLFMGNRYYEYYAYKKTVLEELPPPPSPVAAAVAAPVEEEETMPVAAELPPFPEIQEEEKEEAPLPVPQLAMPLSLPPKIEVKAEPKVYRSHYREMNLPIYVDKEIYKKIQEDMPLLSSALLKQNSEIYQDLIDLHHHKTTDRRRLHDAIESIQKELEFMDNFLFERGKKQHRIKLEERCSQTLNITRTFKK